MFITFSLEKQNKRRFIILLSNSTDHWCFLSDLVIHKSVESFLIFSYQIYCLKFSKNILSNSAFSLIESNMVSNQLSCNEKSKDKILTMLFFFAFLTMLPNGNLRFYFWICSLIRFRISFWSHEYSEKKITRIYSQNLHYCWHLFKFEM